MSEIRKKLERITQCGCGCGVGPEPLCACWDSVEALRLSVQGMKELAEEALALLPPEGETRNDESDTWDLVTWLQVQARASALPYKTCRRLNDAAEEILKLRAEPAPSAEKALRERCEALAKRWDSESGRESFAPVFAEELLEALASSPAPSDDWANDRERRIYSEQVILEKPAPEAPKEERKPRLKDYDFEDLADYDTDD